jgi:hypothetical protein
MRKYLFVLIAFVFCTMRLHAQVSSYHFSGSVGTYTPLASEIILWDGVFDDGISDPITIPDFTMDGITYTTMYVSMNGFVTLGTTAIPTSDTYNAISSATAYDKALSLYCGDLESAESGTPQISYFTNDAGEIVVQWQDLKFYGSTYTGHRLSFQLRMNPATGLIRFIYGGTITATTNGINLQVGLRGSDNTDYNNRETTSDWSATTAGLSNDAMCTFSEASLPAEGLTFTFTNPNCNPVTYFPFTESFNDTLFAPVCWTSLNTSGPSSPGTWDRQTEGFDPVCTPHSGAAMAHFNCWDYVAGTAGILVTPQLALSSDQYEVHFWMYRDDTWGSYLDLVNVYYNSLPNTNEATLIGSVYRYYELSPQEATPNQWYEYVFNVPPGSFGNAYIVLEAVSNNGTNMFLDDVNIKKIFTCPVDATAELEPCGSELNGGCSMPVPAFEPIALDETKCGKVFNNGTHKDEDWYTFTLAHRTEVVLAANAEFPYLIRFIHSPCLQNGNITADSALAYTGKSLNITLDAGTYYAVISPTGNFNIACGVENRYWLSLTGNECYIGTLPFSESFNDVVFPPACWTNEKIDGAGLPGTWDRQTDGVFPTCAPHSGAAMARFQASNYETGTTGILVTPQFEKLYSDQYEVRFWMYRDSGFSGNADSVNVKDI